jgi:hypothetical protein
LPGTGGSASAGFSIISLSSRVGDAPHSNQAFHIDLDQILAESALGPRGRLFSNDVESESLKKCDVPGLLDRIERQRLESRGHRDARTALHERATHASAAVTRVDRQSTQMELLSFDLIPDRSDDPSIHFSDKPNTRRTCRRSAILGLVDMPQLIKGPLRKRPRDHLVFLARFAND